MLALASLRPDVDEADEDAGSPVAFVELAPAAVAPAAAQSDLAPGAVQSQSEANDSDAPAPPAPAAAQPEIEPKAPTSDPSPPMQAPQNQAAEEPIAPASPTPIEAPAPPQPAAAPSNVSVPAAPPSAAAIAPQAAGPEIGRVARVSPLRTTRWQHELVAQIERFKRYPQRAAGRFGVARLAFTIDRQGRLEDVRIVAASGSPVLDEEALATIKRAEPFPTPPDGVASEDLSFVVSIRYARSRP